MKQTLCFDQRLDRTTITEDSRDSFAVEMIFHSDRLRFVIDGDDLGSLTYDLQKWAEKREAARVKREAAENAEVPA